MTSIDIFGLPEYKISDTITEIDGPDVRVLCGIRKFGQVHWLYSVVINAEQYVRMHQQIREAVEKALNIQQAVSHVH